MGRRAAVISAMLLLVQPCTASLFIVAICRDGIVAVADSRITFQIDRVPIGYADGMEKLIALENAVIAQAGYGFIGHHRFDTLFQRFYAATSRQSIQQVLPDFLTFASGQLTPEADRLLDTQRMAIARYEKGRPVICVVANRKQSPCISEGAFLSMAGMDFPAITQSLPAMTAGETARAARDSMERFIQDRKYRYVAGGQYSAVIVTKKSVKRMWSITDPICAMNSDEVNADARSGKIRFVPIPPTTPAELRDALTHTLIR